MNTTYVILALVCMHTFSVCMEPEPQKKNQSSENLAKTLRFNNVTHVFEHPNRDIKATFDYIVKSIQLSADGEHVAVSLYELFNTHARALQVFNIPTGTRIFDAPIHSGMSDPTIEFLSPDGTHIITSNYIKTHLYDIQAHKKILLLSHRHGHNIPCLNHAKTLLAIAFSSMSLEPKKFKLTTYDPDGNKHIATLSTEIPHDSLSIIDIKKQAMQSIKLEVMRSLCFDPTDTLLAVASHKKITMYETEKFTCIFALPFQSAATSISFNHDGTLLAAASSDGVQVFNPKGEQVAHIPYSRKESNHHHHEKGLFISFVNNGNFIAIRSTNDVEVFTLDGKCVFSLSKDGNRSINTHTLVGFSKNSPRIALAEGTMAEIITCLYRD